MIQRGGDVVIRLLENVQQRTIKPLIQATIAPGTKIEPYLGPLPSRLGGMNQTAISPCIRFSAPDPSLHVGFWAWLTCAVARSFSPTPYTACGCGHGGTR